MKKGAPTKEFMVQEWQKEHPDGTQYRCQKETGLSINTIKRWWQKSEVQKNENNYQLPGQIKITDFVR